MEHNAIIEFPNGKGYTPVTQEYLDTYEARCDICDSDVDSIHNLSPEDYQAWSVLDNKLNELLLKGHVGTAVRF